jgi:hypothetical protein
MLRPGEIFVFHIIPGHVDYWPACASLSTIIAPVLATVLGETGTHSANVVSNRLGCRRHTLRSHALISVEDKNRAFKPMLLMRIIVRVGVLFASLHNATISETRNPWRYIIGTLLMGILSFARASWRRGKELQRVSKVLGAPITSDVRMGKLSGSKASAREMAKSALFDLIEGDPMLRGAMEKYRATRSELSEIYRYLILSGADQWAGGHYVPASALCYGATLEFVLQRLRYGQGSPRDVWEPVAFRLLRYFERGEVGHVR